MSPITHFFSGRVFANAASVGNGRDRALVTLSAVIPDGDGLGIVAEVLTRNSSHRCCGSLGITILLHNLPFAIVVSGVAFALARERRRTAALCFRVFHLHLFEDLLGSRGPDGDQWPIPYLAPVSSWSLSWHGQWNLNAWPNFAITSALLGVTFYLAWARGYSPLAMVSERADRELVGVLRRRFAGRRSEENSRSFASFGWRLISRGVTIF